MSSVVAEGAARSPGGVREDAAASGDDRRVAAHACVAATLLGIYDVQVCPYLASLPAAALVAPIVLGFVAYVLARRHLVGRVLPREPAHAWVGRVFAVDVALLASIGLIIGTWNQVRYGFPVGSGVKVMLGSAILGFFIAADLALCAEYERSRALVARGESLMRGGRMLSFVNRASGFALLSVAALTVVVLLAVNQDFAWLAANFEPGRVPELRRAVMIEVAFVTITVCGYFLRVILSCARNLRFYFRHQTQALEQAARGVLVPTAPATTNDELGHVADLTNRMIESLARQTRELEVTQEVTILSLASLAEARDNETGAHLLRTQNYVRTLAEALRDHPRFRDALDARAIELMVKSAPLHDVGKVGIPDRILLKPGKLDPDEFEIMKTHAQLGADALAVAEARLGQSSFMRYAREIAQGHHEKWDGSGYPGGLAGDDIPVSARLMALADVYDALRSERVYKPAFSHEKARIIIVRGRGSHFDPAVVDAFLAEEAAFLAIAARYQDG